MLLDTSAGGRFPVCVKSGSVSWFRSREDRYFFQVDQLLLSELHSAAELEEKLAKLTSKTMVEDRQLLMRLLQAGFDDTNVDVLLASPLAFVAWASGEVSAQEAGAAELAFIELATEGESPLLDQFRSLLNKRPDPRLWQLWADFYHAYRRALPRRFRRPMDELLLRHAERVAEASGGLLGFGRICEEERHCLKRMQSVFSAAVADLSASCP